MNIKIESIRKSKVCTVGPLVSLNTHEHFFVVFGGFRESWTGTSSTIWELAIIVGITGGHVVRSTSFLL